MTISITTEFTPNPQALKFNVSAPICNHAPVQFTSKDDAAKSPLAFRLFSIPSVKGVMIGTDFVTITRDEGGLMWEELKPQIIAHIEKHLSCGAQDSKACSTCSETFVPQSEIEKKIVEILENEIRPALARDGGDAVFCGFVDGVVQLRLRGACSGCPSATITLKNGIEAYLKEYIPEVKEVVRVA